MTWAEAAQLLRVAATILCLAVVATGVSAGAWLTVCDWVRAYRGRAQQ